MKKEENKIRKEEVEDRFQGLGKSYFILHKLKDFRKGKLEFESWELRLQDKFITTCPRSCERNTSRGTIPWE